MNNVYSGITPSHNPWEQKEKKTASVRANQGAFSVLLRLFFIFAVLGMATAARSQPMSLLVANSRDDSILRFDGHSGVFQEILVPPGSGDLSVVESIVIGPDRNLYASSWGNGSVKRYNSRTGAYLGDFVPSGSGGLSNPDQLAFGPDGNLYVSDRFTGQIIRYNGHTGAYLNILVVDPLLSGFIGFTFGPNGNIFAGCFNGPVIGDPAGHDVREYDGQTGAFLGVFNRGNPPMDQALSGMAFGPDGDLYVARYNANLVERYDGITGDYKGNFVPPGSGGLSTADYLVFGPDGNLYVSSLNSGAVLRYNGQTGDFMDAFASVSEFPFAPTGLAFVPEPGPFVLLLGGSVAGGLCLLRLRRRKE